MNSYYVIRKHPSGGYTFCLGNKDQDKDIFGGLEEELQTSVYSLKFSSIEEVYEFLPKDATVIEHNEL